MASVLRETAGEADAGLAGSLNEKIRVRRLG